MEARQREMDEKTKVFADKIRGKEKLIQRVQNSERWTRKAYARLEDKLQTVMAASVAAHMVSCQDLSYVDDKNVVGLT